MSQLFVFAVEGGQILEPAQSSENFLSSLLSLVVVFVGLLVVLALIRLINAAKSGDPQPTEESAAESGSAPKGVPAPGSMGEVKLYTVPDKTAAMLMAIVADKTDTPLNELRFISIREV